MTLAVLERHQHPQSTALRDGPVFVPTVRAGVQLEWHRQGVDIEVEVSPDGLVSWCADDRRTGEKFEATLVGQEETIRAWLRRASD